MSPRRGVMLKGIDTSEWQGNYPFSTVAAAVDFVIERAGFGNDRADNSFSNEFQQARAMNKLRGSYWYVYPNESTPEQEAEKYASVLGTLEPNEIAAFDFEEAYNGDPVQYLLQALNKFRELTGLTAGVYGSDNLFETHDFTPIAQAGYWCWVADWGLANAPSVRGFSVVAFWQYTDKLSVPGISGPVDGDVFLGDAEAFHRYGLTGGSVPVVAPTVYSPTAPTPAPAPKPQPTTTGLYTVRSGDTMSAIAQAHGISIAVLEAANPQVHNPNLIYVGQVLHVPGAMGAPKYIVQPGDTLSGIASKYGLGLAQLEAMNPQIPNKNFIYPGEPVNV